MTTKSFTYNIGHLQIDKTTSKKDLLYLLKDHDSDSFIYSFFTAAFNYALTQEIEGTLEKPSHLYFECGLFHDIGKLGMESDFINYPGQYTFKMYNEMKKHTSGGGIILEKAKDIEIDIINTSKYHHCNYDGSGYPGELIDEEIPFPARLTRVSDSLDAYLTKRCYKDGGPAKEAFNDLNDHKGTSYDPKIIDAFEKIHFKIIDECRREGEDRPSKRLYTDFLIEIYLKDFEMKCIEDVLGRL